MKHILSNIDQNKGFCMCRKEHYCCMGTHEIAMRTILRRFFSLFIFHVSFFFTDLAEIAFSAVAIASILFTGPSISFAVEDSGASSAANSKITTGGASTLQSGRTIAITRGVNLDRSNFEGQNLKGVAFQQSIVRDANFKGANLVGASFFVSCYRLTLSSFFSVPSD